MTKSQPPISEIRFKNRRSNSTPSFDSIHQLAAELLDQSIRSDAATKPIKQASPRLDLKNKKSFPKKPHRRVKSLNPRNRRMSLKSGISSLTSWTGSSVGMDDSTASVVPTKPQDIFRSKRALSPKIYRKKTQESTPKASTRKQPPQQISTPQRKTTTTPNDATPIRHNRATPPTTSVSEAPLSPTSKASSIPLPASYSVSANGEDTTVSTTNSSILNMTKRAVDNVMDNLLFDDNNNVEDASVKSMPNGEEDVDSYFDGDDNKEESESKTVPEIKSKEPPTVAEQESKQDESVNGSVNESKSLDNTSKDIQTIMTPDNDATQVFVETVTSPPGGESASEDDSYFERDIEVSSLALEDAMSALEQQGGDAPDHWHFKVRSLRHKKDNLNRTNETTNVDSDTPAYDAEAMLEEESMNDSILAETKEEEISLIASNNQELEPNLQFEVDSVRSEENALVVVPNTNRLIAAELDEMRGESICSSKATSKKMPNSDDYEDVSLSSGKSKQLVLAVDPSTTKRNTSWWQNARDVETGGGAWRFGNAGKSKTPVRPDDDEPQFTIRKTFMVLFLIIGIGAITGGIAALVSSKRQANQGGNVDPNIVQSPGVPQITSPPVEQATPGPPPSPTAMPSVSSEGTTATTDPPAAFRLPTDDAPTAAPTSMETLSPTIDHLKLTLHERIELFSPESLPALENATTPQAQALEWALQQPTPSLEQYSLATLYLSSTEDWVNDDGWMDSSDVCEWYGIVCNDDKVTEITLSFNNLASTLPDELSVLTDLQVLSISGAAGTGRGKGLLTGSIPLSWGERLVNLVALELYDNQLTGELPSTFEYLTDLELLNLSGNQLWGELPDLGAMTKLDILDLSTNEFSGVIPTEVGLLTNLVNLKLNDNEITGTLPSELGNVKSLTEFQAQDNVLMGAIPRVLYSLDSLSWLDLSGNELDGVLPPSIGLLSSVEGLLLRDNRIMGPVPVQLSMLTNLRVLNLAKNVLTGSVPSQLGLLEEIVTLHLETNLLNGTIPEEVCELKSLRELTYSDDCNICPCCTECLENDNN